MKGIWDIKCVIVGLGSLNNYSGHVTGNKVTQRTLPFSVRLLLKLWRRNFDDVTLILFASMKAL